MSVFGNRLRSLIENARIESKDFAKSMHVQPSTVSNWLAGARFPKDEVLIQIADYFNVSVDYLLGRTNAMKGAPEVTPINIDKQYIRIKVYGNIPAGIPIEAIEDVQGWEDIPEDWTKGGKEYIALKVQGVSMYPKYLDGDIVIIQLQPDCESGQDCACYVDGYNATLKTITKGDGTITLTPINPNYAPQTYEHPGQVKILGMVKELRRKIN